MQNPARRESILFVFTTDIYSWNMSIMLSFKGLHSSCSIECSWLLLMYKMENQIDSCLSWYKAEEKQRANWLFKRSSYKKLIAECVFCRCLSGMIGRLSDGLADFEEHNTHKTLSWLLLHPQSPTCRDLCANLYSNFSNSSNIQNYLMFIKEQDMSPQQKNLIQIPKNRPLRNLRGCFCFYYFYLFFGTFLQHVFIIRLPGK